MTRQEYLKNYYDLYRNTINTRRRERYAKDKAHRERRREAGKLYAKMHREQRNAYRRIARLREKEAIAQEIEALKHV